MYLEDGNINDAWLQEFRSINKNLTRFSLKYILYILSQSDNKIFKGNTLVSGLLPRYDLFFCFFFYDISVPPTISIQCR